jgi:hypothetical protein
MTADDGEMVEHRDDEDCAPKCCEHPASVLS